MARGRPGDRTAPRSSPSPVQRQAVDLSSLDALLGHETAEQARLPALPINTRRDPVAVLSEIEDHRLWHPDRLLGAPIRLTGLRVAKTMEDNNVRPARVNVRNGKPIRHAVRNDYASKLAKALVPSKIHLAFRASRFVIECVRRNQRRETLFALRRTGSGARSPKRYDSLSKILCRRK